MGKENTSQRKKKMSIGPEKRLKTTEADEDLQGSEEADYEESTSYIYDLIGARRTGWTLRENKEAIELIRQFLSTPYFPRLIVDCDEEFIVDRLIEAVRDISTYAITAVDARTVRMGEAVRSASLVCFSQQSAVLQGEVEEIKMCRRADGAVEQILLRLRAAKGAKEVVLDGTLHGALASTNVGDVLYIEPNAGLVRRLGRGEQWTGEHDLEGDCYVQLGRNSTVTSKKQQIIVNLNDIDVALAGGSPTARARRGTNEIVEEYEAAGIARAVDSLLVVKNAHLLSLSQLCELKTWQNQQPWLKIILAGSVREMKNCEVTAECPCVQTAKEDFLGVLEEAYSSLEISKEQLEKYLKSFSIEKVVDALSASKCADEFKLLMEMNK